MYYSLERIKSEHTVEEGECLLWVGPFSTNGYPIMIVRKGKVHLRRVVWNLEHGLAWNAPAERSHRVVMRCGNKACINVAHMDNMHERSIQALAAAKGSYHKPSRLAACTAAARARPSNKLTMEIAEQIRADQGTYDELAKKYGCNRSLIGRIKRYEYWRPAVKGASIFNST